MSPLPRTGKWGYEESLRPFSRPKPDDEYGQLVNNYNSLLIRLENSFLQMRRFAADASHELRTPLTVIRGEADLILKRERTVAEYRAGFETIQRQAASLQRVVSHLLLLADAELLPC